MTWWKHWRKHLLKHLWKQANTVLLQRKNTEASREEYLLAAELKKARDDWQIASEKMNYVLDHDQIDYAIFSLEAAEKRYNMLLRQAKREQLSLVDKQTGKVKVWEGVS